MQPKDSIIFSFHLPRGEFYDKKCYVYHKFCYK